MEQGVLGCALARILLIQAGGCPSFGRATDRGEGAVQGAWLHDATNQFHGQLQLVEAVSSCLELPAYQRGRE